MRGRPRNDRDHPHLHRQIPHPQASAPARHGQASPACGRDRLDASQAASARQGREKDRVMGVTANYLMSLIDKLDIMPIWEIMRENEREAGNEVIVPGSVYWLPAVDWDPTIVVSRR